MSQSRFVKGDIAPRSITPGIDLWLYGLGIGWVICVLVPHPLIVNIWGLFFALPAIALVIFCIFGVVLGALGGK